MFARSRNTRAFAAPGRAMRPIRSFEELFDQGVSFSDAGQRFARDKFESLDEAGDLDVIPVQDSSIRQVTLYPRIRLGGEGPAAPVTGIFVPEAFRSSSRVDAIVYLHGHHTGGGYPQNMNISDYWDRRQHRLFRFREDLNLARRSVILVAPTLGPHSEAGWLVNAGGLDRYMELVRQELVSSSRISENARWGNLVLACHSGGGSPMRRIATAQNTLGANITQCWGFDCFYSDSDVPTWLNWAQQGNHRIYLYFGSGGTAARSREFQRSARRQWLTGVNVFVDGSESLPHNEVPIRYWRQRIEALP